MDYAIQLLEGIGAISKSDSRKASGRSGNYQDSVIAPVSREHDDAAVVNGEEEDEEDEDAISGVSPSIDKVS
jgi:hypothetical protein